MLLFEKRMDEKYTKITRKESPHVRPKGHAVSETICCEEGRRVAFTSNAEPLNFHILAQNSLESRLA